MKRTGILLFVIFGLTAFAGRLSPKKSTAAALTRPVDRSSSSHKLKKLDRHNFEDSLRSLYNKINLQQSGLSFDVFRLGMTGYYSLKQEGKLSAKPLVSFIDFTKKSTEKRFYTIDLDEHKLIFHSLVSHGRNTGENEATHFSNIPQSNQSSLGFYLTGETYVGSKGYSLKLDGMDHGYNDKMRERAVVMHDAAYVSEHWIKKYGRLGRSQGCPALPEGVAREVINVIKDKTMIFAYYNDPAFLAASRHLNINSLFEKFDALASTQVTTQ